MNEERNECKGNTVKKLRRMMSSIINASLSGDHSQAEPKQSASQEFGESTSLICRLPER
jgi:hypothetical protein